VSYGDPEQPLRWTIKSLRQIARALHDLGHGISHTSVGAVLRACGYSLQANRKTREGSHHPDRNAQFEHINQTVRAALAEGQPAISVDAKKKELVGDFKNAGRTWRPRGQPEAVRAHDFPIPELGKAVPYGVYDIGANSGWVSVGIDHDTAAFAVNAIRSWWQEIGKTRHLAGQPPGHHRRQRRQQQRPQPALEDRTPAARRRDRSYADRAPSAARYLQVEQDRAPALLLHNRELARTTPAHPPGHHRAHRRNAHRYRPHRTLSS
jgi:hypothetical protein